MKLKLINTLNLSLAGIIIVSLLATKVFACSACFYGDPNQKALIAAKWGVLSMLIIVVGVLGIFIKFFVNFAKRSKLLMEVK